jgi:hypothetical protein
MTEQELSIPVMRARNFNEREKRVSELRDRHGGHLFKLLTDQGFPITVSRLACHAAWQRAVMDPEIDLSNPFLRVAKVTQLAMQEAFDFQQ